MTNCCYITTRARRQASSSMPTAVKANWQLMQPPPLRMETLQRNGLLILFKSFPLFFSPHLLSLNLCFLCILSGREMCGNEMCLQSSFWIYTSPAQFADDGLGCLTQVRWILEHSVQNLGINLLRLWTGKRRADEKREKSVVAFNFWPKMSCCWGTWTWLESADDSGTPLLPPTGHNGLISDSSFISLHHFFFCGP